AKWTACFEVGNCGFTRHCPGVPRLPQLHRPRITFQAKAFSTWGVPTDCGCWVARQPKNKYQSCASSEAGSSCEAIVPLAGASVSYTGIPLRQNSGFPIKCHASNVAWGSKSAA